MNKKGDLLGEESVKIILAVIGIFILLGLGFKLWAAQKPTDIEQARSTLDRIVSRADMLSEVKLQDSVLVESPQKWYLMSVEESRWGFCEGDFCLCLCDVPECAGKNVCMPTEKFVLLRTEEGVETRLLKQQTPFEADMAYSTGMFYPFNAGVSYRSAFLGVGGVQVTPLFLRFNQDYSDAGRWEWSPDLTNWMSLDTLIVAGGSWYGKSPSSENREFLEEFRTFIEESKNQQEVTEINIGISGKEFLSSRQVIESKGVVIFQISK